MPSRRSSLDAIEHKAGLPASGTNPGTSERQRAREGTTRSIPKLGIAPQRSS
jgi:hypothetical protein